MIDPGRRRRGSHRQPPRLGDEKIRAGEGDQPDDDQKYEAHTKRPPELDSRPSPLRPCSNSPCSEKWGGWKRGEYITAFSECKRVLASICFADEPLSRNER